MMFTITNLAIFLLIMSILNVLREGLHIIKCFRLLQEYKIGIQRTFFVWCSISYIITFLFTVI